MSDAIAFAFIGTMMFLALIGLIAQLLVKADKRAADRQFYGPAQKDADTLLQRIYETRLARNRKALIAAVKMAHWHEVPRSEARTGKVLQLMRR
jgi:hypothetical protein